MGARESACVDQIAIPLDRRPQRFIERTRVVAEFAPCFLGAEAPVFSHQVRGLVRDRSRNTERLSYSPYSTDAGRERHDWIADPGELGDAVDQLRPRDVLATEDVALAGLPAVGGKHMSEGDIADVDEVNRRPH